MSTMGMNSRLPLTTLLATLIVVLGGAGSALAAPYTGPVKEILASHFGANVDATSGGNICTIASGHACQAGRESAISGGFAYSAGVAVAPNGNVYVAETVNNRVQELTATGAFIGMFGWEVNETKDKEPAATAAERNLCTAVSGNVCKAGATGGLAGQISGDYSIAVDQSTGNVFVQDHFNFRVDEYTATGEFVLMVGKDVNETTGGNVCTAVSKDVCKAGVRNTAGGTEVGAFNFAQGYGDLLVVGGPEHLLYVGDEHRVQEFAAATGEAKGEIPLSAISAEPDSKVVALAVDQTTGRVFLAYRVDGVANVIREFEGTTQINEFPVRAPAASTVVVQIEGIALDSSGRLAVLESEAGIYPAGPAAFGSLYDAGTGHLITEFAVPQGEVDTAGVAFNGEAEHELMYAASQGRQEVLAFEPVHVAELLTVAVACKPGVEAPVSLSVSFDCGLGGEVNPEEVPRTEVRFQWGKTAGLGTETPRQTVATGGALVGVSAPVQGLRPDQAYRFRLAGEDENVKPPELLSSETAGFKTPTVAPRVLGAPQASFVGGSSAVLFGEVNPENAPTRYVFQYGPCASLDSCPGRQETGALESAAYGVVGATLEARGLQPGTTYHYRLLADDRHQEGATLEGAQVVGAAGEFTTTALPSVAATTSPAGSIGATSALVSGMVDPDGQPATYEFELGIDNGPLTQYGVVSIGSVPGSVAPVAESFLLTGLQPGTTYAYRVLISSGYGTAHATALTFTTTGLPSALAPPTPLGMLAVPSIAFPTTVILPKTKTVPKKAKKKPKKHKRGNTKGRKASVAHQQGKSHRRKALWGEKREET